MRSWHRVPEELTVWTLYAITQLLLQKRSTESSLFLLSTISATKRAVRHIVHGWVILVILLFCELILKNKMRHVANNLNRFNSQSKKEEARKLTGFVSHMCWHSLQACNFKIVLKNLTLSPIESKSEDPLSVLLMNSLDTTNKVFSKGSSTGRDHPLPSELLKLGFQEFKWRLIQNKCICNEAENCFHTSLYFPKQSRLHTVLLPSSSFSMSGLLWQYEPQLAQPAIERLFTVRKRLKQASLHILWTAPLSITSCLLCRETTKSSTGEEFSHYQHSFIWCK